MNLPWSRRYAWTFLLAILPGLTGIAAEPTRDFPWDDPATAEAAALDEPAFSWLDDAFGSGSAETLPALVSRTETPPDWSATAAEQQLAFLPQAPLPEDNSSWLDAPDEIQPAGEWKFGDPDRSYRPYETRLASDGKAKKPWYETLSIRGYAQFRYNRLGETNPLLVSPQADRSIGDNQSFILRRARLVISGDISDRLYVYIQPDFASGVTGPNPLHFLQIRDYYADIFLDDAKEFRFRVGQSKVPYGFENLQSSQNRIPFDRNDPLNSGLVNERDLGVFFYWAPAEIRERFRYLVQSGLKGSGDYGVVGLGAYNGQTANRPEENDRLHAVFRLTYPFKLESGQYFEPGFSAYTGKYVITRSEGIGGNREFDDERAAWSFVWYPQPVGFQAEYTIGIGPELNEARTTVETKPLNGGYMMLFYRYVHDTKGTFIPFLRWQKYHGGRKHEVNSPAQSIDEIEFGTEWEPVRELELTTCYTFANRTSNVFPYVQQSGSFIRLQLQWNY